MKKILLLEPSVAAGDDLLRAAQGLGVAAYAATHGTAYAAYSPELRERIAGVALTRFDDPAVTLAELSAFCERTGIDGVVACWEFLSPLAAQLAARLGLPGHDPERAAACRNKRLMAELFTAHGVPAPRTVTATDRNSLARHAEKAGLGYPLVVKPAENAASIGVSVVPSPAGLEAAALLASAETHKLPHGIPLDTTLLAQEYVDGAEFSVESLVARGVVGHLAVTEKFTTTGVSRAETGHTVPARLDPTARAAVLDAATRALNALGLRDGPAHTEVKVDGRGRARVLEVGARPPGDRIMRLVSEATGIDQATAGLRAALGETPDLTPRRDAAAAVRFLTAPRAGTLRRVHGLPHGAHVVETGTVARPGDAVGDPHDNLQRVGHLMVRAATPEQANALADAAVAKVLVEMEP